MNAVDIEALFHQILVQIARQTQSPCGKVPRSYLFDKKSASHRMRHPPGSNLPDGRPTLLSMSNLEILFSEMPSDIRETLFPRPYDLGNRIPVARPSTKALKEEMQLEGSSAATVHGFQSTRKAIYELTGHQFDEYLKANPSKALKVMKTLMLLKECSFSHAFNFLRAPDKTTIPSFEVADSYAILNEYAISRTAYLNDMKAHLRLEIPVLRRAEIDFAYGHARDKLDRAENAILFTIKKLSKNNERRYQKYMSIAATVFETLSPPVSEERPLLPLDEQLYIHCSSLEFLNFAAAWPSVYIEQTPTRPLKTFDLQAAGLVDPDKGPRLCLEGLSEYVNERRDELLLALTHSLGEEVSAEALAESVALSKSLLSLWAAYRTEHRRRAFEDDFWFDPIMAFLALATVLHQKLHPTTDFEPFWHGKKTISGSLIAALQNYKFSHKPQDNVVPEAFTRVWLHHLDWFAHSLSGLLPVYETRLMITRHLMEGLLPFIRHHDTRLLRERMDEYRRLPQLIESKILEEEAASAVRPDYRQRYYW